MKAEVVADDFHARIRRWKKTYRYRIATGPAYRLSASYAHHEARALT